MQQLETLAAVLTPVMAEEQLADIFSRVRSMYSDSLARYGPSAGAAATRCVMMMHRLVFT